MKGIQFNTEETQLLIEALLFSSSADVCAEWTPRQVQTMVELAKKLNGDKTIPLNSIYLFNETTFSDEKISVQIKKDFPNLPLSDIITDK